MQYETAKNFWNQCLQMIASGEAGQYIENIAVLFTEEAKAGKFDSLSDDEYNVMLKEVKELAKLWNNQPRREAGALLLNAMEKTVIPPYQMVPLVRVLARGLVGSVRDEYYSAGNGSGPDTASVLASAFTARPPKKIRDNIARCVHGQDEAVRTAAIITFNHLAGRRAHAVFAGPSGCGKSEIWRCLSKEYPGLIRMVDFSRFTAEGWSGSLHLRNIFDGVDSDSLRRRGLIIVLDEADKILCEHAIGAGGTDYHALLQNDILKMMDGDTIEFGAKNGQPALSVDCSKVSVIMLGTFEKLLADKSLDARHIGFGPAPKVNAGSHKNISYDDLISAGMRREVAGRVNKIAALNPLTVSDYNSILNGPVLADIQESFGGQIHVDAAAAGILAEQAAATGLGVRWMRSAIQNVIDEAMFDAPETREWSITTQNGKLRCRT